MFKKLLIILISFFITVFSPYGSTFAKEKAKSAAEKNASAPLKGSAVINLSSDFVDYLQDQEQVVATGNVKIFVENQDTHLEADKVTYDQGNDLIIAEKNVKIINNGKIINGDYARIDLTQDSVLIKHPSTVISQIKIEAKTANIYPKKGDESKKDIDVFNGKGTINDQNLSFFLSNSGAKFLNNKTAANGVAPAKIDTRFKPRYNIRSKKILVRRTKDADIITLLNSKVSINKYSVANIPSLTLTTNKETNEMETSFPEAGRKPNLGGYFGWGPVINLPGGRTFKAVPVMTIDHGVGVGGLTRFTSSTNRTEVMYSTLKKQFLVEGRQRLPFSESTIIQYGKNSYVENGFFGDQLPNFIVEAVDTRKLASAMNFDFYLRPSIAYIQADHRWSTGRFQVQGDLHNNMPLIRLGKHGDIGASSQFNVAVYGNGDTYGVLRAGPTVSAYTGPFYIWAAYYQGGIYGKTPFIADRFYYGKSNVTLNANYKLTKLLSLQYVTSLNLSKDNYDGKLLAENRIYCWVGPEDLKFRIGYDTRRKSTTFDFNMILGSDRSAIEFDKLKVTED